MAVKAAIPKSTLAFLAGLFFLAEFGAGYAGFSLETVYITPFFIRLETPWLLDSFIWLAPAVLLVWFSPLFKMLQDFTVLSGGLRVLFVFHLGSITAGLTLLIGACLLGEVYRGEDTSAVLVLALLGFLLLDMELTTIETIAIELLSGYTHNRDYISQWSGGWKSIGRVAAYLLASCDALQLGSVYIYSVNSSLDCGRHYAFRPVCHLGCRFPHNRPRTPTANCLSAEEKAEDRQLERFPAALSQSIEAENPLFGPLLQLRSLFANYCLCNFVGGHFGLGRSAAG